MKASSKMKSSQMLITAALCVLFAIEIDSKCVPDDLIIAFEIEHLEKDPPVGKKVQVSELLSSSENNYVALVFFGTNTHLCKEFLDLIRTVTVVAIADTTIRSIEKGMFDGLTSLINFKLDGIAMKTIPAGIFQNMPGLKELNFEDTNIKSIEDGAIKNMQELHTFAVSDSALEVINAKWFENCPNIKEVDFSYNEIRTIRAGDFSFLTANKPKSVKLAYNKIRTIESGAFTGKEFKLLDLEGNHLKTLSTNMFPNLDVSSSTNSEINLQGNRFTCVDADTLTLLKLFEEVQLEDNYPEEACKDNVTRELKRVEYN